MFEQSDALRGVITNRARNLQVLNFHGLMFGSITPTDVDAAIEFDNRLFIFIEAKFIGTPIKRGQELFLARMADNMNNPPHKYGIAIVADHYVPSDQDIDASKMIVRNYRMNGQWRKPLVPDTTVLQAVRRMGAYVEKKQGKALYTRTTQSRLFVPSVSQLTPESAKARKQ